MKVETKTTSKPEILYKLQEYLLQLIDEPYSLNLVKRKDPLKKRQQSPETVIGIDRGYYEKLKDYAYLKKISTTRMLNNFIAEYGNALQLMPERPLDKPKRAGKFPRISLRKSRKK